MLGYSSDTVPSPRKSMVKATTLGRQNKVRQDLLPDRESLSSLSAKKISDYSLSVVSLAEPPSDPLVNLHYQDDADRNAQDQQPLEDGERYGAEHPLKRRRINDRYLRKRGGLWQGQARRHSPEWVIFQHAADGFSIHYQCLPARQPENIT